jgi:lysozyme family protein
MNKIRFQEIFSHTLLMEGGGKLHNVKGDSGGYTKFGVAYNYNKQHFKSLDEFKKMTYDKACEIAYLNYCVPIQLDLVSKDCQAMLFDFAYNAGCKTAIKAVQRIFELTVDGILGAKTKAVLGKLDKETLYYQRMMFYQKIVENDESKNKFFKGWKNRADYFLKTSI